MLIWPFSTKGWYECIPKRRGKNANGFSVCLLIYRSATRWWRYTKSRGIHTVITAHARQQYFTKCQGCPYIIVEIIFSLAPWIDVWMFSVNSLRAWLKNIDMSTFHNSFFSPNWKAVNDHWQNPESSGHSVEPKQLFKPTLWARNELHWQFALFSVSLNGRQNERCSF